MWDYAGHAQGGVDQATGNKPTFEENILDRNWYTLSYDLTIAGRLVLVDSRDRFTCMTTVKSAHSPVHTIVTRTSDPPPVTELCRKAIEFTTLTIPKMPPPAQ